MSPRILCVAIATGLLAACASSPEVVAPPVRSAAAEPAPAPESRREAPDQRTAELVAYFASVARAGAAEQKRELAQSAAAFARSPTSVARLRIGGLHAQPAPGLRDDAKALALLEPLAAGTVPPADRPVADLAALLYAQVAERQRAEKAEARKQEALREQIEAMKSIERSIIQREERQRARQN